MTDLQYVLTILDSGEITGAQTVVIDVALSGAKAAEIPDADVQNVMDFIDIHLSHNVVSQEIRSALDFLQIQLRSRQAIK